MSNYNLIYEAANLENFERQILSGYLTKEKLVQMMENNQLSESELRVVEELFGGLRNLGRAAGSAVNAAGRAVGNAVNTGAQKVAGAGRAAGQQVANAGRAVAAGAGQMKQNVQNMYATGEAERVAQQQVQNLDKLLKQIQAIIAQVRQTNPQLANLIGKDPKLSNLQFQVGQVQKAATKKASNATAQGFTGGVGQAATNAYQNP